MTDLPDRLCTALTERFTELGNPFSEMRRHEKGPDGWPASHPVGPHGVAEVLRELLAAPMADQGDAVLPAPVDRGAVLATAVSRAIYALKSPAPAGSQHYRSGWDDGLEAAIDAARNELLRRMADEAQQPEEAWPSESQWRVEMYDPGAGQWMPAGTLTTKAEAERRMALAAERAPKWRDDETDVRRRIVRTTITYTVEPEAQR